MENYTLKNMNYRLLKFAFLFLLATLSFSKASMGQTPVPMSLQPGLSYSENFSDITNWTNNFASGIGANRWGAVAVNATGTIPDGSRISVSSATFAGTSTSGGVQRGGLAGSNNVAGTIVLLSTGATSNSASTAIDFFMDFTGVNAGTLSFDWATVFNSTGDRGSSIRVYTSINGTTFTELTAAQVLDKANNVAASGSIATVALPATFNNVATARIRFYEYNGALTGTGGSRAKISLDNVTVTATSAATIPVLTLPTVSGITLNSATLGATVTSDGGAALSSRGTVYGTSANPTGNILAEGGTTVSAFTHNRTSLTPNTNYFYRGYAVNTPGTGYSADGTFTTLPDAPVATAASGIGSGGFTATWTAPAGGAAAFTYTLQYSITSDFSSGNFPLVTGITSGSVSQAVSGLSPSTAYYYHVLATNSQGDGAYSNTIGPVTTSASATVPVLTSPTATSITFNSAILGATVTSDGGAALSSRGTVYDVIATPIANALAEGGTAVSTFSHSRTSLTANTLYTYRGYAINTAGTGYSSDATFTTKPDAPTSAAASAITTTGFTANWTAPVGGSEAFTYTLQYSTSSDFSTGNFPLVTGISSGTTSFAVSSLTSSTPYYYHVLATNISGDGAYSATQTLTTLAAPTITITGSLTAFSTVVGTPSATQSYQVSGVNLTSNIAITPPADFEIRTGVAAFSNSAINLTPASGTVSSTTIDVRYNPAIAGSSGAQNISHVTTGDSKNQAVSGSSIATEPTIASTVTLSTVLGTSMIINFTGGNGASHIVVVRPTAAVSFVPTDGATVPGIVNSVFTSATDQGATGNRIVFDGAGSTVTVTGLSLSTVYHVAVYEYNGLAATSNYLATPGINNATTLSTTAIPVPMAAQPLLSYTENFADIANWTNNFASGIGASRWAGVAVNATGTIPDGLRTTVSTATFITTSTSGGVQRGGLAASNNPAGTIVQLATGATDNSAANAIELFLDFTGVNAGTLSFDWATVFNSTGDRGSSLRVYASTNGTTYTELTGAQVLDKANNVAASGSIVNVALPASFTNSATARLRFYEYNFQARTNGSRAKIAIDNVKVTGTAPTKLAITTITPTSPVQNANFSVTVQAQDANNIAQNVIANTNVTISLNTGTGVLGGTLTGTILAGTNNVVISGLTYTVAEAGVILTATRTSGDALTAGNSASFTVDVPATPTITVTGALTSFLTGVGTNSTPSQTYTVQGADLTSNLVITPPAEFQISTDDATWVSNPSTIDLVPVGVTVAPTTIYVRYSPSTPGPHSGDITHTSAGAITKNNAVSGATSDVEPTVSSVITFSTLSATTAVVNFTGGNGSKRILVASQGSAVSFVPTDGIAPSGVNANYSTATDQGSGNKIVYDGTGTTVTVSGLTPGSTYHFAVYEYNGTAGTINYRTTAGINSTGLPAPISYTGGTYTQNFNSLPLAGSFSFFGQGSGPFFTFSPPINATANNGWQIAKINGSTVDEKFSFDNGASNSGSAFSYGTNASTDRALGALASAANTSRFGAILVNNTAAPLSEVTITYTGEQWRDGGSANTNTISFGYQVGGTDISTGSFTAVTGLNFSNLVHAGGTGQSLDGNNPANRAVKTATFCVGNWAVGASLVIRWDDFDEAGGDDGLSIDDFSFSASGGLAPNCVAVTPVNVSCPTGVSLTWPASGICDSYKVYFGTDNPPTDILFAQDVAGALSYSLPVLTGGSTYFYQVVPYNVFGTAAGCTITSFTTGTAITYTPNQSSNSYKETFEGVAPPALPCGITVEDGFPGDLITWKTSSTFPKNGANSMAIDKNPNNLFPKDDWFFSAPMNLTAGRLYRIYFNYSVSSASTPEQFEIYLAGAATSSTMTTTSSIAAKTNLINLAYAADSTADILPLLTGVYYYGIHASSLAAAGTLYLDDIQIKEIPVSALSPASCDTIPSMYQQLIVQPILGATDYKFKIENGATGFSYEYTRNLPIPDFRLKWAPGVRYADPLPGGFDGVYDISVSYKKGGLWSPYGPSCPVTMGPFPSIKLRTGSCGTTLTDMNTVLSTDSVPGATNYEYQIIQTGLGYDHTWLRGQPSLDYRLSWAYQYAPTLVDRIPYGYTYKVLVRAQAGYTSATSVYGFNAGSWGMFGDTCLVTLAGQPQTQLNPTSCGALLSNITDRIFCVAISGAGNYRYKVYTSAGNDTMIGTRNSALNDYRLTWLPTTGGLGARYNTTYHVKVSDLVGGVWSAYGPECDVTTPASPLTKLQLAYCTYTLPSFSALVYCDVVPGATNYRYHITGPSGFDRTVTRNSPLNDFRFSWSLVCCGGQNMLANTAYNVEVASYAGGVWSAYGSTCTITTGASVPRYSQFIAEEGLTEAASSLALTVYPNPAALNDVFAIELNGIQSANEKIQVEIFSMLGEKVYRSEIITKEESRIVIKPESSLSAGVYMIEARLNGKVYRQKFVVN